jgi:hypothetical protein
MENVKVGDLLYVGSMGKRFNHQGYPVLVISIFHPCDYGLDDRDRGCKGLINGEVRYYNLKSLKKE